MPGLPLALPFEIQPRGEETLGTQQACSEGVVRGAFFGAAAPHTPSSLRWGSRAQSLCVLSLPPPFTPCPLGGGCAWGGWCQGGVERGPGLGAAREGTNGGGWPGTRIRVTLPIWVSSPDPGPGLAYQGPGVISRSRSRERVDR